MEGNCVQGRPNKHNSTTLSYFPCRFDHQPCVITSEIVRDRLMVDVVPRMNVSVILDSKGKTVRTFPFVITTAAATECA